MKTVERAALCARWTRDECLVGQSVVELVGCVTSSHHATMIKTVLVFNNHGKPRLVKFFTHMVRMW